MFYQDEVKMFELDVTREFSAAHFLRGYNGHCQNLHGHNWSVQVFVQAEKLDEIGISVDFVHLKKVLDGILSELDHHFLNELPGFADCNPTSENLARYIFKRLSSELNDGRVKVSKVRVCETATSGASYFE